MDREKIVKSLYKMRSIAVPKPNLYGIAPYTESTMPAQLNNILRVFKPISPRSGRKPNSEYGGDFDIYEDVLSDSPITIGTKMMADWHEFDQHVIVQLGLCNFRCWYCYVDFKFLSGKNVIFVSADEIIQQFLGKREEFIKRGETLNVLRISGGEPMLAPDLTLTVLRTIRELGLDSKIAIKTETNLSPLLMINGKPLAAEWCDFDELAEFKNFIIHPTIHGISESLLHTNSAVQNDMFDGVLEGIQSLLNYKLDFYPSFGANTSNEADIPQFFEKLKKLNRNLPLRIAVRKFNFDYDTVADRKLGGRDIITFEPKNIIKIWDTLLRETYGVGYAQIPRHKVSLYT